jgi:hypothetical protein
MDTISFRPVSARYVPVRYTTWNLPWKASYLDEFKIYA